MDSGFTYATPPMEERRKKAKECRILFGFAWFRETEGKDAEGIDKGPVWGHFWVYFGIKMHFTFANL